MSAKIILFSKNPVQINKKMIFANKMLLKTAGLDEQQFICG